MDEITREMFLLHSETDEYKYAIDGSVDIVRNVLQKYNNPIISASGGKDSLVMMHMVISQANDIPVFHWDYGRYYVPQWIESETILQIESVTKNIIVKTSQRYNVYKRIRANIFYKDFFGNTIKMLLESGYDLQFVGLRKEESLKRKRKINGCFIKNGKIDECYPLLNLTWKDIWAYIVSNDLPYLTIYDKYAKLLGYDKVRFATFFDPEFDKLGASNVDGVLMPEFKHV